MKSEAVYQIEVAGCLDDSWSQWFAGMTVEHLTLADGSTVSRLTGPVQDQAMLRTIIDRMFDLNMKVLSIQQKAQAPSTQRMGDSSSVELNQ